MRKISIKFLLKENLKVDFSRRKDWSIWGHVWFEPSPGNVKEWHSTLMQTSFRGHCGFLSLSAWPPSHCEEALLLNSLTSPQAATCWRYSHSPLPGIYWWTEVEANWYTTLSNNRDCLRLSTRCNPLLGDMRFLKTYGKCFLVVRTMKDVPSFFCYPWGKKHRAPTAPGDFPTHDQRKVTLAIKPMWGQRSQKTERVCHEWPSQQSLKPPNCFSLPLPNNRIFRVGLSIFFHSLLFFLCLDFITDTHGQDTDRMSENEIKQMRSSLEEYHDSQSNGRSQATTKGGQVFVLREWWIESAV